MDQIIKLESKLLRVKAWAKEPYPQGSNKTWKTKVPQWKDVLPGDFVVLTFVFGTGLEGARHVGKPVMQAKVYRNNELLFEDEKYIAQYSHVLEHFVFEEMNNSFKG